MELKTKYVFLLIGVFIGVLVALTFISLSNYSRLSPQSGISKQEASSLAKDAISMANDQDLSISAVVKEGSAWKIIAKSDNNMREYYLTSDGKFLFSNPVNPSSYIKEVRKRDKFIECLDEEKVTLYGDNRNSTILQIQILGGVNFVDEIFVPLNNEIRKGLVEKGVSTVPAFEINGEFYQGVKTIEWLENKTDCTYGE